MEKAIMAIMVWRTLAHPYHSYFLNVLYNCGFPVEHFGPVLRGDFGSPSAPWAQNFLRAPLCGAEALRALRAPNRPGLTAAQQPPVGPNSSAHSSRARSANRVGASATQWPGEVQPNHCRA